MPDASENESWMTDPPPRPSPESEPVPEPHPDCPDLILHFVKNCFSATSSEEKISSTYCQCCSVCTCDCQQQCCSQCQSSVSHTLYLAILFFVLSNTLQSKSFSINICCLTINASSKWITCYSANEPRILPPKICQTINLMIKQNSI